ncbi:thermolysin metallopeptidase family [Plakobranchus ocellatus]|uniref:Thermolysin metallopeptidase family n=1 Tax=Plakobranchus ocellatus TaxID=259542 RepID=A0AAV4AEA6_9GAST|nr:thermolysin metallopeptidase family [Plakobranchus ocellatus]
MDFFGSKLIFWKVFLIFVFAQALSVQLVWAARKIVIFEKKDVPDIGGAESSSVRRRSSSGIVSRLNLGANTGIQAEDTLLSVQGNKKKKYSETYKGYKVFNTGLDVEEEWDGSEAIVSGDVYADIEDDLGSTDYCDLSDAEGKEITLSQFNLTEDDVFIVRENYEHYVYVDITDKARWAVDVELSLFKSDDTFSRPVAFIDTCTREVLDFFDRSGFYTLPSDGTGSNWEWNTDYPTGSETDSFNDWITDSPPDSNTNWYTDSVSNVPTDSNPDSYTGAATTQATTKHSTRGPPTPPTKSPTLQPPGQKCDVVDKAGNPKRVVKFGPGEKFCLGPMRRSSDDRTCFLENQYVKTVDLKNTRNDDSTEIASFQCSRGYDDEKNGGFSPVLDAFFFTTASSRIYRQWYDYVALSDPVPYAKAHFGTNYINAYWDGTSMVFGDGDGQSFYPLTNLDTVAHEMAHGVTEKTSNLIYRLVFKLYICSDTPNEMLNLFKCSPSRSRREASSSETLQQ